MKLLLAEDDAILADALSSSLRKAGFEVEVAGNGAVAEYLLLLLDDPVARVRETHAREVLRFGRRAQSDQASRLAIRQRAQEYGIDHAEKRNVRTDPQPEPDNGDE